jgi:hypothetical protein
MFDGDWRFPDSTTLAQSSRQGLAKRLAQEKAGK